MKRVFSYISQSNLWESKESVSGRGSELACTVTLRASLPGLFEELGVKSILDAPCGDFNWMRHIPLSNITYTGIDVVPEIIEQNQQQYGTSSIRFMTGDITSNDLPQADLIICRDCLVHLPFLYGCCALKQFKKSGARYLLITTYPETTKNIDTAIGSWRSLNLCLPPFHFFPPQLLLSDPSDDTGKNPDKSLGLWRLDAIKSPEISRWNSLPIMFTSWVREYFHPSWRL
ncbi:MAG: class I SAM-dependent methyltransferase [Iphinoe sp. HA4291-MV1]|jgi:hypothetical protein|nr:class I SAM-dependent methyltransferase [Iphinoe sp. HA4291-MV1]